MFATFVYQENKMEFYAAWDLAESQISSQQVTASNLQRKPHLPAPLLAKTDPYQHLESEEDDDSSSDSSSEDKKTDGLNDESMEEKDGLNDECKEEKEKTSDSDTEESDMQEDEMKQKTDEPPSPTNSEVQNLLTMACGLEKKEESVKKEKDEEEKTTTEVKELKRPTSEPVSDPVVQKLRKIAKDLDEGECILDTLTQALYDSGVEAQAVGATPKWMPPPQQAPQPVRAKAPEQLPIKARPTPPPPQATPIHPATAKAPPQATAKEPQQATAKAPQQASTPPWTNPQPTPPPPQHNTTMHPPQSSGSTSPPGEPLAAKAPGADRVRGFGGPQYEGHLYVPLLALVFLLKLIGNTQYHPFGRVSLCKN